MCWCVRVYRNGESHAYHHVSEMYLTMRIRVARCSVSHCIMTYQTYQLLRIRAVIRCVSNVSERISKSVSGPVSKVIRPARIRPRDTAGPVIRIRGGAAADTGAENPNHISERIGAYQKHRITSTVSFHITLYHFISARELICVICE